MCTYRETRQLRQSRPQDEGSSLDDLRAETRRLRQASRARGLAKVMAMEMEVTETETARSAAAASTQRESKQRS